MIYFQIILRFFLAVIGIFQQEFLNYENPFQSRGDVNAHIIGQFNKLTGAKAFQPMT
jgi:hypothetical protein